MSSTGTNNYGLNTATLRNSQNKYVDPTPASALAAFGAVTPPDSNHAGHYDPVSSDPRDRANPQDWVEPTAPTSPLANPSDKAAYPIVGSTNALLYSCYATQARVTAIVGKGHTDGFFDWYFASPVVNSASLGILAKAGFAAVPSSWRTAISETFIGTDSIGLGLSVSLVGTHECTNGETGG